MPDNGYVEHDAVGVRPNPNEQTGHSQPPQSPLHPQYHSWEARHETFSMWPHQLPTSIDMAQAGFIFKGTNDSKDLVECYFCGALLGWWQPNDNPQEQHRAQFPNCGFIQHLQPPYAQGNPHNLGATEGGIPEETVNVHI